MNAVLYTTLALLGAAPALAAAPQSAGATENEHVTWSISISGGNGECRVECQDGQVTATLDGQPVPDDRIVRAGDQIIIRDEDGDVAWQLHNPEGAHVRFRMAQPWLRARQLQLDRSFTTDPDAFGWAQEFQGLGGGDRPRIGISMEPPGEALAAQLGVDPERVVVITEVSEGLPAAEAGVQKYDVVMCVDGQSPVTEETVRECVQSKEDGDTIVLRVLRHSGETEIPVTVRVVPQTGSFGMFMTDPSQSGVPAPLEAQEWSGLPYVQYLNQHGERGGDVDRKEIAELLARAQEEIRGQVDNWHSARREELVAALESLEAARARLAESGESMNPLTFHNLQSLGYVGDPQGQSYLFATPPTLPEAPSAPDAPALADMYMHGGGGLDGRIRGLEERLARIEELLERISNE